ncbi:MAG: hypothetical protein Q8Q33_02405, partial [Chlamydiota bacterium]|nr:hypothetical protein [Chlamydiota bacterium]
DVFINSDQIFGEDCLSLIHDKVDLNRIIFIQGIFLCEIRVLWKASLQEDRDALLRIFAEYMDSTLRLRWNGTAKKSK